MSLALLAAMASAPAAAGPQVDAPPASAQRDEDEGVRVGFAISGPSASRVEQILLRLREWRRLGVQLFPLTDESRAVLRAAAVASEPWASKIDADAILVGTSARHEHRTRGSRIRLSMELWSATGQRIGAPIEIALGLGGTMSRRARRRLGDALGRLMTTVERRAPVPDPRAPRELPAPPPRPGPDVPAAPTAPMALRPAPRTRAQQVEVSRLHHPVVLDGKADEAAWKSVTPFGFISHFPEFGRPPSERSELLLGYDDEYLYVAFRNYDSRAHTIRTSTLKRDDEDFGGQDLDTIIIDSFNDDENAYVFSTNPAGVRIDQTVWDDMRVGNEFSTDLNTFWDVAVHRDHAGWHSEFRVPLSSLRYQQRDGRVVMGLVAYRIIPRTSELVSFPPMPTGYGDSGFAKPSHGQDLVFEGLKRRVPLYVTPYLLGGAGRATLVDPEDMTSSRDDDLIGEAGVDAKYGVASNFTLDLTVNTDFAQVEADDQQINLNRFDLFTPERRQFFLERARIFAVPIGGFDTLFYSRRVGLIGDQAVRIYGGARGIGRFGRWDVGILDMQTAELDELSPSENLGVLRVRRQFGDGRSYAGGVVTTRTGADGSYNIVAGNDDQVRLWGDDFLTLNLAGSETKDPSGLLPVPDDVTDQTFARLQLERRRSLGVHYSASVARAGPAFIPGLGFLERDDFVRVGDQAGYGWAPSGSSVWRRQNVNLDGVAYFRNSDGELETGLAGTTWNLETRSDSYITMSAAYNFESVLQEFSLSEEAIVPAGDYSFPSATASYRSPSGSALLYRIAMTGGGFFDGYRVSPSGLLRWKPSRHWETSIDYELNHVTLPERDQTFVSHLGRLRLLWLLNRRLAVSSFVQVNTALRAVIANTRLRFNPSEGHDLYVVHDESVGYGSDSDPELDGRAVLLKYAYTFDFSY